MDLKLELFRAQQYADGALHAQLPSLLPVIQAFLRCPSQISNVNFSPLLEYSPSLIADELYCRLMQPILLDKVQRIKYLRRSPMSLILAAQNGKAKSLRRLWLYETQLKLRDERRNNILHHCIIYRTRWKPVELINTIDFILRKAPELGVETNLDNATPLDLVREVQSSSPEFLLIHSSLEAAVTSRMRRRHVRDNGEVVDVNEIERGLSLLSLEE